jgi:hypothetical protein
MLQSVHLERARKQTQLGICHTWRTLLGAGLEGKWNVDWTPLNCRPHYVSGSLAFRRSEYEKKLAGGEMAATRAGFLT